MAKNDFKAFATGKNANVMSQEEWEALPALLSGFTAGKASSAQVNKVIRQASFIAAALAQFVSDKTQRDVLDNGDLPGFVELLGSGFAVEYLSRKNPFGDIKSDGTVKTALENLGLGELSLAGTASGVIGLNGYVTIPLIISGSRRTLIIQWGQARFGGSGGEDAGYLNDFPFAFPSACYGMIVSHVGHTPSGAGILSASAITSNQFRGFSSIATAANAVLGRYIAIGV
ncbi:TPA: hypothetical protein ACGGQ7_003765 [Escherichia coli]|uniref:gp53-like domain-containing protein n=1 Tax=Escherichia coli TaxID=562 RepID=UPI0007512CDF|nr:hypothetical protein [Escherichia coli]AVG00173.1 hypothetical protein AL502_11920 [Escherichia coli]EFF0725693.1 hypothetical protein [Escherichia coli]EFF0739798.1 hypothetical protein [Escherichia coli]EFF0763761.1 hypothetical protein [Escherichia coli]EFI6163669.1 hypothetical protein [Escherichia coli]